MTQWKVDFIFALYSTMLHTKLLIAKEKSFIFITRIIHFRHEMAFCVVSIFGQGIVHESIIKKRLGGRLLPFSFFQVLLSQIKLDGNGWVAQINSTTAVEVLSKKGMQCCHSRKAYLVDKIMNGNSFQLDVFISRCK